MDFKTIVSHLWPMWVLGFLVLLAVYNSKEKKHIRIEKKAVIKFLTFMAFVSAVRFFILGLSAHLGLVSPGLVETLKTISSIPVPTIFGVYWEDACHGLPLLLLGNAIGDKKWLKPVYWAAMIAVMTAFGLGHMYQGVTASILLSLYIPASIHFAKKFGFGTVMLCHIAYDLVTILTTKAMLGFF